VDRRARRDRAGHEQAGPPQGVRADQDRCQVMEQAGLGSDWQPKETRHTLVSITSASGAAIEDIADAAGHVNANITRAVYRHVISDTVTRAPAAMDRALAAGGEKS
jgi:integrase